jgi:hypothetical protein
MFSLVDIVKYLTFISYIGFIISCISGFYELTKTFDLCKCMISVLIILNVPVIMYVELINKNTSNMTLIHYTRSYAQFIISLLIIGVSHIGVGFGIYGITMCIANLLLGVFDCDDTINHPVMVNPTQNSNTDQNNIN